MSPTDTSVLYFIAAVGAATIALWYGPAVSRSVLRPRARHSSRRGRRALVICWLGYAFFALLSWLEYSILALGVFGASLTLSLVTFKWPRRSLGLRPPRPRLGSQTGSIASSEQNSASGSDVDRP